MTCSKTDPKTYKLNWSGKMKSGWIGDVPY